MGKKFRKAIDVFWGHKYVWATVIFIVVVGYVSPNSFWNRYLLHKENEALREEIRKYEEAYERDSKEFHALETNPEAVERVARVRHFMKTENEDVYVIEPATIADDE